MSARSEYLKLLEGESLVEEAESSEPVTQSARDDYLSFLKEEQEQLATGFKRATAQAVTLGFGEEIEAMFSDKPYEEALADIRGEMAEFARRFPKTAFYGELLPGIATGVGAAKGLAKAGVKSMSAQGAIELGAYGVGTGETAEERLEQGMLFAATGGIFGKALDVALPSSADIAAKSSTLKVKSKETVAVDDPPVVVNTPEEITEKAKELYDAYRPQLEARNQSKTLPKPKTVGGSYETGGVFVSGNRPAG